jgi:hypothetical protein
MTASDSVETNAYFQTIDRALEAQLDTRKSEGCQ